MESRLTMPDITVQEKQYLMRLALEQATHGMKRGELPIGAVVARLGTDPPHVLGCGFNRNIELRCRHAHAEMEALTDATANLRINAATDPTGVPLDEGDIVLVSTLEPCIMCYSAAVMSSIGFIIYGLPAPLDGGAARVLAVQKDDTRTPKLIAGVLEAEVRALFEAWIGSHNPLDRHWAYVSQLLSEHPVR